MFINIWPDLVKLFLAEAGVTLIARMASLGSPESSPRSQWHRLLGQRSVVGSQWSALYRGVGRVRGVGRGLGVALGGVVGDGVAVGLAVGVGVGVPSGVTNA